MDTTGRTRFLSTVKPVLTEGLYKTVVNQTISSPKTDTLPSASAEMYVGFPHFNIPESDIYSFYPGKNACGVYSNTLAHIVFTRSTLPWERLSGGNPWLALIVLRDDEVSEIKTMTIDELLTQQTDGVLFPLKPADVTLVEEKGEDLCRVVDIGTEVFARLMPLGEELQYLTHVKRVEDADMLKKTDDLLALDGDFSVITANRFVPSGLEAVNSTVHLVSLEGYADYLKPQPQFPVGCHYARLVSLFHWSVQSRTDTSPGFADVFEALTTSALSADDEVLARGHIPMRHITRSGETTVSLYRGPLLPYDVKADGENRRAGESYTADGQIIYDPDAGIFDMSYSAAWQFGRILALADKAAALNIFRWRRRLKLDTALSKNRAIWRSRAGKIDGNGDVMHFFTHTLCPELAEEALIAPSARAVHQERRKEE